MIDSLRKHLPFAGKSTIRESLGLAARDYALLTLHRPSNVDELQTLGGILDALNEIGNRLPIVFPVHPRTLKMVAELGLERKLTNARGLLLTDPLGYLDFLQLLSGARLVLTDSGGIQEETTVLGIPCITLRENTERPITVEQGTNTIAGTDPARIVTAANHAIDNPPDKSALKVPELWDGRTADRILDALLEK
jgi:UDP-N-acetylglucosamine 2-epimerase (non-hydrolysing)